MNVDYLTIPDGYKTIIKKFLIKKKIKMRRIITYNHKLLIYMWNEKTREVATGQN